jgi:tetratricopeptide (TPR) repeat protein
VDSLQREFIRRMPTNAMALTEPARTAAVRGDYDRAEELRQEALPQIAGSRQVAIDQLGFGADLALVRGKVREAARLRADWRAKQAESGLVANARLDAGLDSVLLFVAVLEDPAMARTLLDRAVRRAPVDSIPFIQRSFGSYLAVAALVGDSSRARQWHADSRRSWQASGRLAARPAGEAMDDAWLALAERRYEQARASLAEADRLHFFDPSLVDAARFLALDHLQLADSTIAAGERFLSSTYYSRLQDDALFLAGIRQRLGELYEARGDLPRALEHYTAFVDLWKDADPELQPRVRDVRARVERIRQQIGPKG